MACRARGSWMLVALLAAGLGSADAGDSKTFKLKHPTPKQGDSFCIEQKTSFVVAQKGGPEKGHIETTSSYKVSVVGTKGTKLVTRFDLDPTTTTTEKGGKVKTETEPGRTVEATLEASEVSLLPVPTGVTANQTEGLGALGSKDAVSVGDTWTAERSLPVAAGFSVPVKSTYTVASVEKDPRGHDLLRLTLKSEGSAELKASGGVRLNVTGEGSALFDPERADRPVEVRLSYRFVTSGGEGADSETRTEITITTHELALGSEQEKSR